MPVSVFDSDTIESHPSRSIGEAQRSFTFGGVQFEFLWRQGDLEQPVLRDDMHVCISANPVQRTVATVTCSVESHQPEFDDGLRMSVCWDGPDSAGIRAAQVEVRLKRGKPGVYTATAYVVDDAQCWSALVMAIVSAVVEREGGLLLHASGIDLEGTAILFCGPSGAGKTTACNQFHGIEALASDRVVVFPSDDRWFVGRLHGGRPMTAPFNESPVLPLGGILRVVRGQGAPFIAASRPHLRQMDLLAAVQSADRSFMQREAIWLAIERLAASVPVDRIATVLGTPINSCVEGWLGRSSRFPHSPPQKEQRVC